MPLKRKRPDRPSGDGARPSPHRPADTTMAQHDREDGGGRGGGGGRGRGGRGGFNRRDSNPGHGRGGHHYNHQYQNQQTPTPSRNASFSGSAQSPTLAAVKHPKPPQSPIVAKQPAPSPTTSAANATTTKHPVESQTSKNSSEQTKQQPSPKRSKYYYENLTDDRVQAWNERGRAEIISHGTQSREDVDITELSSLFQEFIHAVLDGRLDPADAGICVKEILGQETADVIKNAYPFAPHTLFLDTLSIVMDLDSELYRPALRDFLIATAVSPTLMREILDAPLLQQLGLIRDTFARLGVRQATNLLYRQANYNLLREESEGYSKLITEIFTTNSIPPPSPNKTFEKVKALIGTFDLDVGRVLDVVLDVAATILIKQVKFFVKFLRVSSWWPSSHLSDGSPFVGGLPTWATPGYPHWNTSDQDEAENVLRKLERDVAFWDRVREVHLAAFFELGGRRVTERHLQQKLLTNGNTGEDAVANIEQEWIKETNTLPAPGNRVAAQLLGFKLRFYNSDMREKTDVLPANLLYLASLLIKIGFISLTDLWPHLSPADDQMDRVRQEETEKLEKQERESRGGQMNALLMAGVLPQGDDDNPTAASGFRKELPKKAEQNEKKTAADDPQNAEKLPEPLEQKVALLIQLLTIGAIPESLFILGRFPWIPDVFPEVLQRIHRILHVSLEKVYKDSRPCPLDAMEFPVKDVADADQAGVPKGQVRLSKPPQRKTWRWPYPDACDTNESQNFRFYLDEWSDNVPVCQTIDDVFALCGSFLNLSGVNIGKDESLLSKLASIGAKSLATDKSAANRARWQDLLRRLLMPALSHTKANASVVNAVWELVKQYPLITRYSMYAEWFEGQISRLPTMRAAFARATSETRATMKRVSLTNLSEMAKRLAKTSYASPGIVFKVAFEQLEVYSNLIEAFVECAKYFTDLSYDVLVWSLLSSLGKSRSRTQAEHALTTSKWLQALSRFSGKVFRRYPVLDPIPVLQYVDDQLSQGNATDLIILKEFISSMGGIVDAADFTDYQVLSMAGGAWLRRHTLIRAQDKRYDNVKSSARLVQALSDSKLAAQLLINLAQHRQAAVYKVPEEEAHIKFLSSTIDDSHQALIQYLDFLWTNLEPAAFDAIVPSIPKLISSFGLSADLAFLIGRSSLAHRMFPWKERKAKKDSTSGRKSGVDKEGDVKMSDAKTSNTETSDAAAQDTADAENPQKPDDPSLSRTALTVLHPIVESLQASVSPEVWQKMTPELHATFWALQLGDICFPEEVYVKERQKIMSEWQTLANDRSDMSRRAVDRKMEKRKELMDLQGYLLDELSEHGLRKAKWKFYLTKMFQSSFPKPAPKPDTISDVLMEQCFLPRLLLSAGDAEYTFRFIKALHEWNAPAFKLMSFYDRLFNANRLRGLIFSCTVREAEYLGRFLKLILEDLSRWHKNEPLPGDKDSKSAKEGVRLGAYDKEGKGSSDQPRLCFPETHVEHAQFRDLLFRWHKNLNTALKTCLGGSEWMHIRNAITILRAILDFFPAVDFMASQFTAQLQKITKREAAPKTSPNDEEGGRVDLSVAAQGAMSELQKRKSKWVMVQAFRSNAAGGSRSEADKAANSNLRPMAPDFKPQPPKSSGTKISAAEEEDGEVRDGADNEGQTVVKPPKQPPSQPVRSAEASAGSTAKPEEGSSTQAGNARTGPSHPNSEPRSHRLPDRPTPHNLPSRPDVPIPGHAPPERYNQSRGPERRDVREPRPPRDSRADAREAWDGRENRDPKEHRETREIRDARPLESDRPARAAEYPERRALEAPTDSSRPELPPRPGQQERDRQYRDTRSGRPGGRYDSAAYSSGPPPVANEPSEPAMNPERAAFFAQDNQDRPPRGPDPGRQPRPHRSMAGDPMDIASAERGPMDDRNDAGHFSQTRTRRDDGHERGPRPSSPRRAGRNDQDYGPTPGSFDDRHGRSYPPEPRSMVRDTHERSPMTGHGFRGERPMDRELERGMDKIRDPAPSFPRSGPRMQDPEHRLPHQDHNYGRLNPVPSPSDAPSGPRGRGRSTARGGYASNVSTPGRVEARFGGPETPRAPSPDRLPPTGPASGRGRRGGYEPGSGPNTPSGVHGGGPPERARNFGGKHGSDMQGSSSAATAPSVVHPDRLAQMGSGPPAPHNHGRHTSNSERHAPPSRPPHPGNMGPPPPAEVTGAPTGPAASNDRMRSGGGRRQLAGINNTLQQSQSMPDLNRSGGPRGGHPRQLLGNSDAQVLTGGSPASTPSQERQDFAWQDNANWGPANGGDGGPRRGREERDGRLDRPGRSSRRSSREREHDRGPHVGRDTEPKDAGDYQNRRTMGNADLSDKEREPRRPTRDAGARNPMGVPPTGGRDLTGPREPRGPHGEGGPGGSRSMEEWPGSGGGYRGRGGPREGGMRPGEDRREPRDDRGRKRRSEDGVGFLASERDKRPRRG
ncbi:hypothetical protein HIM_07544 [Hirsutella minnesotensis 3608]|uniref:THO complex subunit 2 n=1 Tax=Hirsutella minnesotensis 3608 TaxID=1043627 RepID=A0A0F7ZYS3_9HYPO|nr:hypothetical protein HIM_07544 [Hirsutella minnesotensis 3608]